MADALMADAAALVETLRAMDGWGMGVYAVLFLLLTLAFVPASLLTAVAGFLYGPVWGTALISPVGVVSAALAFSFGRTLTRAWVHRQLDRHPRLLAVDQAVARGGFRVVFLLRLASIVPFAPMSYAMGASRISSRDFLLATWLGLLPGTFLYVYLGSLVSSMKQILVGEVAVGTDPRLMTLVGFAAAALAMFTIARYARHAVKASTKDETEHEQTV